jgi:predicted transcriptional regulator
MDIESIAALVEGNIVSSKDRCKTPILHAFSSDLMSDVLTVDAEHTVLITGLANLQTIRTSEMSDINCIIIARNKRASDEMVELADQSNIVIIETAFSVFRVSGLLHDNGIKPLY